MLAADREGRLTKLSLVMLGGQAAPLALRRALERRRPRLIVLAEPTTGLDVTTQAHVLGTARELAAAHQVAALYVSHDLAVVGTLATL